MERLSSLTSFPLFGTAACSAIVARKRKIKGAIVNLVKATWTRGSKAPSTKPWDQPKPICLSHRIKVKVDLRLAQRTHLSPLWRRTRSNSAQRANATHHLTFQSFKLAIRAVSRLARSSWKVEGKGTTMVSRLSRKTCQFKCLITFRAFNPFHTISRVTEKMRKEIWRTQCSR
jgi:hypothetical protein